MAGQEARRGLPAANDPGRDETTEERDDRNLIELLQELRVGVLGVQVLFGFLLSLPFFATNFRRLSSGQHDLCIADLLLAAVATALFSGPVAYHRLVFRHHRKEQLLRMANAMAIAGLAVVALAVPGAVLLAVSDVARGPVVAIYPACTLAVFVGLWFVLPLSGARGNRG